MLNWDIIPLYAYHNTKVSLESQPILISHIHPALVIIYSRFGKVSFFMPNNGSGWILKKIV
jgi:hypothetical protein